MKKFQDVSGDHLISLAECRRILNRNGNHYSDVQINMIRGYLIALAEIQYTDYKRKVHETSRSIHSRFHR